MSNRQAELRAAILDAGRPVPTGLSDAKGAAAGRRFAVYRNNVAVSLTEALEAGFPILQKLLGQETFKRLAGVFLRAHPPSSPLMMHYGAAMPEFLEKFEPLQHIGYLADVARLELALRVSYHAADAVALPPERLGEITPGSRLLLAPATQLLQSQWPLFDIWRYNTENGAPKPAAIAQDILITRPEYDPVTDLVTPAQSVWLQSIMTGQPISAAQDAAARIDPDFDLSALLGVMLRTNAISDLKT
ncbi:MAG: putative DNA-binding domain-containing protein [Paracoccaceae bacterium]